MAIKMKCARCQKKTDYYKMILWSGPNGFRRYRLCEACRKAIEKQRKAIIK